eukprot:3902188-Rhodomonas_salina.1
MGVQDGRQGKGGVGLGPTASRGSTVVDERYRTGTDTEAHRGGHVIEKRRARAAPIQSLNHRPDTLEP